MRWKVKSYAADVRISEASRRTGVAATTLRYYESLGLIGSRRLENGYRDYDDDAIDRVGFIQASKELGLSLVDVAAHLVTVDTRSCTDVRDTMRPVLARRLQEIDDKIVRLQQLRGRLAQADQDFAGCPDRDERCSTQCVINDGIGATGRHPGEGNRTAES